MDFGTPPRGYRLPATARLGHARLAVSDLGRSVDFYGGLIGLSILRQDKDLAVLGGRADGVALLELDAKQGVAPIGRRSRLGLYHTALALPGRGALGSLAQHLIDHRVSFGSGDHLVSEALYLRDPDGLTVEVYADRPQQVWQVDSGDLRVAADPLNLVSLTAASAGPWSGVPGGTTLGHMHFYVDDLDRGRRLYQDGLGMTITTQAYPSALFFAAGDYHHHVGMNTWAAGSPVAGTKDARLLRWSIVLADAEEVEAAAASLLLHGWREVAQDDADDAFRDDWGLTLVLESRPSDASRMVPTRMP